MYQVNEMKKKDECQELFCSVAQMKNTSVIAGLLISNSCLTLPVKLISIE